MSAAAAIPTEVKRRNNFMLIPNMADDDLNIYEFRLLGHYTRICGQEGGRCWQGIKTIHEKTGISLGMITRTRNSLEAKGFISVSVPDGKSRNRGESISVSIVDRWQENTVRYCKDSESANIENDDNVISYSEIAVSPGETNKIYINQEPEKEKEKTTTTALPDNSDIPGPEALPTGGSGYTVPVLTEVDLWESNAMTLPAEIEPPARIFVLEETPSKHEPPAQLQPGQSVVSSTPPPVPATPSPDLPPLSERDTPLGRAAKCYERYIGGTDSKTPDMLETALEDFGEPAVLAAIEGAYGTDTPWRYALGTLRRQRAAGTLPRSSVPVPALAPAKQDAAYTDLFDRDHEPPPAAAPEPEPVDPNWQRLGWAVQGLSAALYGTFRECEFGGVKDGILTVIAPTTRIFNDCYRGLRHNRWLYRQAHSIWDDVQDVEFIQAGVDILPEGASQP